LYVRFIWQHQRESNHLRFSRFRRDRPNDQLNISHQKNVNNIRETVLKYAAGIVMGCDPLHDQLLDGEDDIPRLWSNFDIFQSQVCEDGPVNFELDLQVL
jgi:hypothetical protein